MQLDTLSLAILIWLTSSFRVASAEQLAVLGGVSATQMESRLRRLCREELIARALLQLRVRQIDEPLFVGGENVPSPNAGALSWELTKRWRDAPRKNLAVYWATRTAVRYVGGAGGTLRQPFQVEHDLLLADVFVMRGVFMSGWVHEDLYRQLGLAKRYRFVPDACVLDDRVRMKRGIEIGGRYSPAKLRQIHSFFSNLRIPYEIW